MDNIEDAVWSTAYVNDLPDSAFLFIETGGEKDDEGKTKPRSLRHFPYKDKDGSIDLPHLRNAIARIPQAKIEGLDKEGLQEKARRILDQQQSKSVEVEKIESGDLSGGGKKPPATFGESFLKDKVGMALTVTDLELGVLKKNKEALIVRAEKCADSDAHQFLLMHNSEVHGTCRLGLPFEMSFEELQMTEPLHGLSMDLVNTLWPQLSSFYGYRVLNKNFEGASIAVDVISSQHWVSEVKPKVEKKYVSIDVFKNMTEDRVVAAAVLVPNVPDLHGDIYDGPTVRRAAYSFMENYFKDANHGINVMHKGKLITNGIRVLQSFVLDNETTYVCELSAASNEHLSKARAEVTYPVDTWIMYAKIVDDALWESAKSGEFTGWSIQGMAQIEKLPN